MRRETAEKPETKEGGDEKQSRRDRDLLDRYHAEQTSKSCCYCYCREKRGWDKVSGGHAGRCGGLVVRLVPTCAASDMREWSSNERARRTAGATKQMLGERGRRSMQDEGEIDCNRAEIRLR